MSSHLALLGAHSPAQDQQTAAALAAVGIAVAFVGPAALPTPGALFVHAVAGPRWAGLAQALRAHWPLVAQHHHVWLPDATVEIAPETLARLFAVCGDLGLDLAQPALTPRSSVAHPIAWQHAAFQLRFTNVVDSAAPMLSCTLLEQLLPTLATADGQAAPGSLWPQSALPGRVAIVDATPAERLAGGERVDLPAHNLGGLLETGDALCLSARRRDVDALLEALIQSAAAWTLDAGSYAQYLAQHLQAAAQPGSAALPQLLEQALAGTDLQFNRVVQPRGVAAALAAATPPPDDDPRIAVLTAQVQDLGSRLTRAQLAAVSGATREQALCDADLRDLRTRHAAVLAERDRQAALLHELAGQLARAQYHCRELAPVVGAVR